MQTARKTPPLAVVAGGPESNRMAEDRMIIKPGWIYSIKSGGGEFSLAKVLVVEGGLVHMRLYTNQYKERPTSIDLTEPQVSIGHVPLLEAGFADWDPMPLLEQPVTEDELVGYRFWKQDGGGFFA